MGLPNYYFGLGSHANVGVNNPAMAATVPTVGARADEKSYSVSLNVSGVLEEDIAVVVKGGQLIVEFEKEYDPTKVAETNWDKQYGIFTRYIDIPADADASAMKKSISEGVLTVEMARGKATKTKKKPVESTSKSPEATL